MILLEESVNIQNLDIFDFELSQGDMEVIADLDTCNSQFFYHQIIEAVEVMASYKKI